MLALVVIAGCGGGGGGNHQNDTTTSTSEPSRLPVISKRADDSEPAKDLGFPGFATKNTTRVGGADPVADAAGVAQAVYPGRSPDSRPAPGTLVGGKDWRAAGSPPPPLGPPPP